MTDQGHRRRRRDICAILRLEREHHGATNGCTISRSDGAVERPPVEDFAQPATRLIAQNTLEALELTSYASLPSRSPTWSGLYTSETRCLPPPIVDGSLYLQFFITTYMLPASVSWWNGDNHLPPFFCQIDVAKTFPPCFLPSQVASCVPV